jgi:hypothetical protein
MTTFRFKLLALFAGLAVLGSGVTVDVIWKGPLKEAFPPPG